MDLTPLSTFHFLRPVWLLALPPLLALAIWLARRRGRDGPWSRVIDAQLLPSLRLDEGTRGPSPWPIVTLVWVLTVLALAGPAWQSQRSEAHQAPRAWVFVLDLSPSMMATDLAPNRVTRARYALEDLLGAARDARVGLLVFAAEPHAVTPLTDDVATVGALLSPLVPELMPVTGDRLGPALGAAERLFAGARVNDGDVVVLTDGFTDPAAAFNAAGALRQRGASVHVVGIGSTRPSSGPELPDGTRTAPLDADRLRRLATAGGGFYGPLPALPELIERLQAASPGAIDAEAGTEGARLERWRDDGVWLVPALLVLAAVLGRRGWL